MPALDYVDIPHCATLLQEDDIPPKSNFVTPFPSSPTPNNAIPSRGPISPTKSSFNLPSILISSSINLPATHPTTPRDGGRLLSTKEPLSLQTITSNFRRFVSRSGPVFWLQDRIEEIVMWRRGWKFTCIWMAMYTFICYFPRICFFLPHILLISVLLNAREISIYTNIESTGPDQPGQTQAKEGTPDWFANLQAIQNLMGAVADLCDAVLPYYSTISWSSSRTSPLLSFLFVSLLPLVFFANLIPIRAMFLCLGLLPFALTHPFSLEILPNILRSLAPTLRTRVQQIVDNDNLTENHWFADIRQVELWENERWSAATEWSKSNLRAGERGGWTKGRDGWSDVVTGAEGNLISNPTLTLSPGYEFVETEEWRVDHEWPLEYCSPDDYGWTYMDDSWLDPRSAPNEEWKTRGMTRRRKWVRRIYRRTST